jgi:hypothetical protein
MLTFYLSKYKKQTQINSSKEHGKPTESATRRQVPHFFSSFSASAAFLSLAPIWRWFILSTRSLPYALKDFISSVTLTRSTVRFSGTIGMYSPVTWVAVASSSGAESPACTEHSHKRFTQN